MTPGQFRHLMRDGNRPPMKGRQSAPAQFADWFVARIKASPVLLSGSTTRWRYAWEEVVLKDDNTAATTATRRASGTAATTYAINLCELCQAGASPTKAGPGVTISTIPAGFTVQPIAANTCVIMHALRRASGKQLFCFSMPNAIDGTCQANLDGGGEGGGPIEEPI
jgi:hypothetical protein